VVKSKRLQFGGLCEERRLRFTMEMNHRIEKILEEKAKLIDKCIEKYVPRKITEDWILFKISPPKGELDLQALNKTILEPFWEFLDRGGKRWRAALFLLLCEALGSDPDEFLEFAAIPEIIHNGTLIADDIEDSSNFRRGKPCTYKLYGLDVAINLSSFMYFIPLLALSENIGKLSEEKARRIYEIYVNEMINLSLGQAIDIAWHKKLIPTSNTSQEQYLQMCAYKTGTLARMAAKMAAVISDVGNEEVEKIGKFAESIGIAFQIQDDILDIIGEKFAEGKGGLGMDITEGKLSIIIIYTLKEAELEDKEELKRILEMHTKDEAHRMKAISIIRKYGSIEYARNLAARILEDGWNEVSNILPSSKAKETLRMFSEYLIKRQI